MHTFKSHDCRSHCVKSQFARGNLPDAMGNKSRYLGIYVLLDVWARATHGLPPPEWYTLASLKTSR